MEMRDADEQARLSDNPTSGLALPNKIAAGDLFAVTKNGVFALNPEQVKFMEGRQRAGVTEKNLPSITDTRAAIAEKLAQPTTRQTDALGKRIARHRKHAFKETVRKTGRTTRKVLSVGRDAVPNRSATALTSVARVIAAAIEMVANMFAPPPPLSRDQRERKYQSDLKLADQIEAQQKIDAHLDFVNQKPHDPIYDQFPSLTKEAGGERIAERDSGGHERERKRDPWQS